VYVTSGAGSSFVRHGELENATVENIVRQLNDPGSAEISIGTTDPKLPTLIGVNGSYTWQRDLQIWRGDKLRHWGPILRPEANGAQTTIQSRGSLAHFLRRYAGPTPSQAEWGYPTTFGTGVSNPLDFPDNFNGWTVNGLHLEYSVSTSLRVRGTKSAKTFSPGGWGVNDGGYLYKDFTFNHNGATGGDLIFFVVGWYYMQATVGPFDGQGLDATCIYPPNFIYDEQVAQITASAPQNGWYRLETAVKVPTGVSSTIRIALAGARTGTIYWDNVNVFQERFIGSPGIVEDYGQTLTNVANYFINSADKSNLNMGVSIPACGVTDSKYYDIADNTQAWEIFADYAKRGLYDFDVTWDAAGTTRTFTGYTPTKGQLRSNLKVELGRNITAWSYARDGDQTTSKPRVIGSGQGASREVAEAMDTTSLGGLTLESVETAATDASLSSLDSRAAELLRVGKAPTKIPTLTVKNELVDSSGTVVSSLIGEGLDVGDTIPVEINYGWVQESGTRRVVYMKEFPRTDTIDIGFNT